MNANDFFFAGGTMKLDNSSYVTRQADDDLFEALSRGDYCYVLTSRQMGKSSLMVRTAGRLRETGTAAKIYDPTGQGQNVTIDQWYVSFLCRIGRKLDGIEKEIETFWASQPLLSPVNRFARALDEIILPRFEGPLVIFVDEIDYLKSLRFPMDEFFAAIRECHNRRAEEEAMRRLTFCLLGVATPSELVSDPLITPFNIGRRIELHDFTEAEAAPLARGLRPDEKRAQALLRRVLYWTGGHPYLTQRLCQAVADDVSVKDDAGVDALCGKLFLTRRASELDDNLVFARKCMLRGEKQDVARLDLYASVHKGQRVADDGTNPTVNALRLAGVTRADGDWLQVRNRIYEHVFDAQWIKRNLPDAEARQRRKAYRRGLLRASLIGAALLALVGSLAVYAWRQQTVAEHYSYHAQIRVAQQELENANINRVEELLNELKPMTNERGFEWDYLWQASHPVTQTFSLSSSDNASFTVEQVAFSENDKQLFVAAVHRARDDGRKSFQVFVFNRSESDQASTQRKLFEQESQSIRHLVQFSSDGRRLLIESENGAGKWIETTAPARTLPINKPDGALQALAISSDGRRVVTVAAGGKMRFTEVSAEGEEVSSRTVVESRAVSQAMFSADGQRLAIIIAKAKDKPAACGLWDFASGRKLSSFELTNGKPNRIAISPNGNRILIGLEDGKLQLLNADSGQVVDKWPAHNAAVTALAFSPDGAMLASGSEDRRVRLWDAKTNGELATIRGNSATINSVVWSHDAKLLAVASDDGTAKVWNVADVLRGDGNVGLPQVGAYLATAFDNHEKLLAVGVTGTDGATKLLNLDSRTEVVTLKQQGQRPIFAKFSPDARLLAIGRQGREVEVWELSGKSEPTSFAAADGTNWVYAADFTSDGKRLAFVYDWQTVKVWDVEHRREVLAFIVKPPHRLSYRVVFSPDGNRLAAACSNGDVAVWNRSEPANPMFLKSHTNTVRAIAFSPDGSTIATGGDDRNLLLWDAVNGKPLQTRQAALVERLTFSPDGKRLVSGAYNGEVKIWDVATGNEMLSLPKHPNEIQSISFSENGRSLTVASLDGMAKLWRMLER